MKLNRLFWRWEDQPKADIIIQLFIPSVGAFLVGIWLLAVCFHPFSFWLFFFGIILAAIGSLATWNSYIAYNSPNKRR